MTIYMEVLIETLKALSSYLRWCSYNVLSTQDHDVAVVCDESADVFSCKGGSIEEYW